VTTGISSPVSTFTKKNEIKAAESGSLSDQRIDKRSPWLRARLATGSRICSTGGWLPVTLGPKTNCGAPLPHPIHKAMAKSGADRIATCPHTDRLID
jgi:hypothetical protein